MATTQYVVMALAVVVLLASMVPTAVAQRLFTPEIQSMRRPSPVVVQGARERR
jgi:hypothetical protein